MKIKNFLAVLVLIAPFLAAQSLAPVSPAPSMKQIMLDLIHPAANGLLFSIARGPVTSDKEWAVVRHNAATLTESGNLLLARNRNQEAWTKSAQSLADAGQAAYAAALAKDSKALAGVSSSIDASCTSCHKQYRPNVFPREVPSRNGDAK